MSSKTDTAPSSQGPVVRTRVATRAPEVHVSFPESTSSPSLLARCGSKVSGWIDGMSEGTITALAVGISFGMTTFLLAVNEHRQRASLQEQMRDLRTQSRALQVAVDEYLRELRSVRARQPERSGVVANAPVLFVAPEASREVISGPQNTYRGNVVRLEGDECLDPPESDPLSPLFRRATESLKTDPPSPLFRRAQK